MRILETLVLLFIAISIPRFFRPNFRRRLPTPGFELAGLLIGTSHILLEGYRWQMLPALMLLVVLVAAGWRTSRKQGQGVASRWLRVIGWGFVSGIFVLSILLPLLLPVPRLATPSGSFAVGTRIWHWTDPTRSDPYAAEKSQARELMVQAWYPIAPQDQGSKSPWMSRAEIVAPEIAAWLDLPRFFLDHLVHVSTHATQEAPIAWTEGGFPVVLFSHGYGGFRAQNTHQMQHLASHGYIVLAADHTYAAVVSVFPEDRIAPHNPDTLPDELPPQQDLQATRALGDQWANDMSFILDQLASDGFLATNQDWSGSLDLSRVGVFGHSTGGGAAIEFCCQDARCEALLTLDPFVKPVSLGAIQAGFNQFSLHMFSEIWSSTENLERFSEIVQNSKIQPLVVSVLGSAHYDFSDLPLLSPLAHAIGLKGPINGAHMVALVNAYLLAYFNQELSRIPMGSDLLLTEEYPEVVPLTLDG